MSLDYNLRAIKDRDVHFPPNTESVSMLGTLNLKVNAAIWACMATQIGEITSANADEWFDRYVFWNKLQGEDFGTEAPYRLTREDVHHLVGLKTNVFPDLTHAKWMKRQWNMAKQP